MAKRKNKKGLRNEALRGQFNKLVNVKKMQSGYAIQMLADKYFLDTETVRFIVYEIGHYKPKPIESTQLSLF